MSSMQTGTIHEHGHHHCADFGDFRRLNYFYGQMLSPQDMQTEQDFFREKLRLHNRCLHGYGVVCGLLVSPAPSPKECESDDDKKRKVLLEKLRDLVELKGEPNPPADINQQIAGVEQELEQLKRGAEGERQCNIRIDCGLALDCQGDEIIVQRPIVIDPLEYLSSEDHKRAHQGDKSLYVSVCFCEQPIDPTRPILTDACGASPGCVYGKVRESFRVVVTVDPPQPDKRCLVCCEPCPERCCVLLARISDFRPKEDIEPHHIHNEVRRPLSTYVPTVITGISWRTGHQYTPHQAWELMGTHRHGEGKPDEGLRVRFSRKVRASTVHPGVIDTWLVEGGRGHAGNISNRTGELIKRPHHAELIDEIIYRDTTGESLNPGDRILITLRTNFILDECCRPVDGENVGGRVPHLQEYAKKLEEYEKTHNPNWTPHHKECAVPPIGYGPWRSGDGVPGGTFESWFYIRSDKDYDRGREESR